MQLDRVASGLENMFAGRNIKVCGGNIIIDLLTCEVKFMSTMTMENAAKLSATYLYEAMAIPPLDEDGIPVWTNSICFCDEHTVSEPAVTVVDDKLFINRPPFKGDMEFWKLFTKFWAQNILRAMSKSLAHEKHTTLKERILLGAYETQIKGTLPLE